MLLELQQRIAANLGRCYIVTPRVEIIDGLLQKRGVDSSLKYAAELGEQHGIFTPIRLRNLLAAGTIEQPEYLLVDEAHHGTAVSYQEMFALSGMVCCIGFTATAFRGTPKETAKLREQWGEPIPIISFAEAAERGILAVPHCTIHPLIDDDKIEVINGEFIITQMTEAVGGVADAVVELCRPFVDLKFANTLGIFWDRPTIISVPSIEAAKLVAGALNKAGLAAVVITAEVSRCTRDLALADCIARRTAIVQINVISEGIDIPARRLIDLRPTMSPVFWQQQLGRITRPTREGEPPPEYICCCRNLLRHAYSLDGMVPPAAIAQAEKAFGGVGKRAGVRAIGFEGIGKFKATELPLADGTTGLMYCVSGVSGTTVTQFVVMTSPTKAEALVAMRGKPRYENWERRHKWVRIETMPDVVGFASVPPSPLTEKQAAWWKRSAATRGLDPEAKVNARNFQAMPVLFDIGCKLV